MRKLLRLYLLTVATEDLVRRHFKLELIRRPLIDSITHYIEEITLFRSTLTTIVSILTAFLTNNRIREKWSQLKKDHQLRHLFTWFFPILNSFSCSNFSILSNNSHYNMWFFSFSKLKYGQLKNKVFIGRQMKNQMSTKQRDGFTMKVANRTVHFHQDTKHSQTLHCSRNRLNFYRQHLKWSYANHILFPPEIWSYHKVRKCLEFESTAFLTRTFIFVLISFNFSSCNLGST